MSPPAFSLPSSAQDVERARALVLRHGWNATSYQILNPGIRRWFSPDGEAVVGYVEAGGYWIAAGAPVCPADRLGPTMADFAADARRGGRRLCYFGAQERLLAALPADDPAALLLLGAQPAWNPRDWSAILARKASLRQQLNRARNKGVRVRPWPVERAERHPELERCLRQWLATRGLPPMHFLTEWHLLARLLDRRVFVAERDGRPLGFLLAAPVPLRGGWLIEQIIRGAAAPNGAAELLLDGAMRTFAAEGAGYVTLGLAPLSRAVPPPSPPPPWRVRLLLGWTRLHGRRFYNFRGLEHFKSKFQPERWEPIYAVADHSRVSLGMLYAIAGAFGGGPPPRFILRALLRAAGQECRWVAARLRR